MVICNVAHVTSIKEQQPDVYEVDTSDHFDEPWSPPFNPKEVVRIKTSEKFSDFYNLHEILGEGKYGKVYRCQEKHSQLSLAAKCIRLRKDADRVAVEKEVAIMTQMRHKCIAQIYDAFATSATDIILIMEIIPGGELFDRVVEENYILTEPSVALIVYQICDAVRYIHENHILHLDLKPENIMCVSHTGNQIKLIDFGLAQYYDGESDLLFMAGTPEFAAPEVIKFEPLNFHTDMWSIGVITYILLSGISPFLGDNTGETYLNVEKGEWEFVEEFDDNGITDDARDFISNLLIMDKNKRMLPEECLVHPWLVNYREKARNVDLLTSTPEGVPLDTTKLRKYVKNQKFRKAVFGVLFVNGVAKILQSLQAQKSEHGIQYVKNMLNSTCEKEHPAATIFKKIKRPRNSTKAVDAPSTSSGLSTDELHFHAKPKRQNREKEAKKIEEPGVSAVLTIPVAGDTTSTENSSNPTPAPSPVPKKKKAVVAITRKDAGDVVEVVKKVKKIRKPKASATTSSTEELAKKPKRSSSTKKSTIEPSEVKVEEGHEKGEIAVSALQSLTTIEIPISIPESKPTKKVESAMTKSFEMGDAKLASKRPGKSVLQGRKLPFLDQPGSSTPLIMNTAYTPKPKAEPKKSLDTLLSPSTSSVGQEDGVKSAKTSREPSPSVSDRASPKEPLRKLEIESGYGSNESSISPRSKSSLSTSSPASPVPPGDLDVSFSMSLKPKEPPRSPSPRIELKIPEITYEKSPDSSRSASPSRLGGSKSITSVEKGSKTSSREPSPAPKTVKDELKLPGLKKSVSKSPSGSRSPSPTPDSSKSRSPSPSPTSEKPRKTSKTTKNEESIALKKIDVTSDDMSSPSTSTSSIKTVKKSEIIEAKPSDNTSKKVDRRSSTQSSDNSMKSGSKVGDLLKKLQKSDDAPMRLAVSDYVKKKFDPSPAEKSDFEASEGSNSKILPLKVEKKTITETKTTIKKKTVSKESTKTEKDAVQNENSNSDSCEVNIVFKTTVKDGSFDATDKAKIGYEVSETKVEKSRIKKKTSDETLVMSEKSTKKAEKLGVERQKAENGIEVSSGSLKATEEAQTKAILSSKLGQSSELLVILEAKKTNKLTLNLDGTDLTVESTNKQRLVVDDSKSEAKPLKKALKSISGSQENLLDKPRSPSIKKKVAFSPDVMNDENTKPDDNPAVFDVRKLWPEPGSKRLYSEAKKANREPTPERSLYRQRSLADCHQLSPKEEEAWNNEFAFNNLKSQLMKWMTAEETYDSWKERQRNTVKREVTATGNVKKAMNKWKMMEKKFGG